MFRRFLRSTDTIVSTAASGGDMLATAFSDAPIGDGAKKKLLLFPMGPVVLRDGRKFRIDDLAHAQAIVAASNAYAGKRAIPADYDHQLIYGVGKGNGGTAPASGWFTNLSADADGIHGEAEWTASAAAKIDAREYRHISPTFTHDTAGRVLCIRSVSLVNDPAIDDLPAVASTQENKVDKIAVLLGLAATASEADILAAITAMKTDEMTETAAVKAAAVKLGLAETATIAEVATAAASARPDPAKFVPIEGYEELKAEVTKIKADRIDALIATASTSGKVTPAMADWFASLAKQDEAKARAYLDAAPVIATATSAIGSKRADEFDGTAASLTADELAACAVVGITPDQFAASKKKEGR